jgi:hypothetical protein
MVCRNNADLAAADLPTVAVAGVDHLAMSVFYNVLEEPMTQPVVKGRCIVRGRGFIVRDGHECFARADND